MATRHHEPARAVPLDAVLATIPSLPRAVLSRLVTRMIEHMDELDPDPDAEPEEDCCIAGDDDVCAGPMLGRSWRDIAPGEDEDMEEERGLPPRGSRKAREHHRDRVRREVCEPVYVRPRERISRSTPERWRFTENRAAPGLAYALRQPWSTLGD